MRKWEEVTSRKHWRTGKRQSDNLILKVPLQRPYPAMSAPIPTADKKTRCSEGGHPKDLSHPKCSRLGFTAVSGTAGPASHWLASAPERRPRPVGRVGHPDTKCPTPPQYMQRCCSRRWVRSTSSSLQRRAERFIGHSAVLPGAAETRATVGSGL